MRNNMMARNITTDTRKMVMIVFGAIIIIFGGFYVFGSVNDETGPLPAVKTSVPAPQQ
jgi:hypothetical protein